MMYFENGVEDVFPGTCGSAVWAKDNLVVGLFQWYHSASGMAIVPSINVLVDNGYTISPFSTVIP